MLFLEVPTRMKSAVLYAGTEELLEEFSRENFSVSIWRWIWYVYAYNDVLRFRVFHILMLRIQS